MKKLLILGAGGYGKTVADAAQQLGCYNKIAFLDDGKSGASILGKCEEYVIFADETTEVYPAFGDNTARMEWIKLLTEQDIPVATLVHPTAYVSPTATLAPGVMVLPHAVVNTGVTVETGCIVNIGALIDHDTVLEEGVHLAPGAIVKAENRIPSGSKINSGMVVENREYPL